MVIKFKKKCPRCRKNYVVVTSRNSYGICYDCQKNELDGEIEDPKMKKLFDIPEEFYKTNPFLRSIKINYLRYNSLTEKQLAAFKKTVEKMSNDKANRSQQPSPGSSDLKQ